MGTSSFFSRDDDDNIDTGSTASRDDIALVVPALVDDDGNDHCDNYSPSCTSTPKRQKVIDGIFRPSSSASASFSVTSSPKISLAPRCLEFLPSPSVSFTPATATATATATSELEMMKGKRLFVIGEDDNDDDDDDEYKEDDPTMNLMKENEGYDTVYNKGSSNNNGSIPTRTSRQEFLFRMNHHHDRYSFINRRFVLKANNNKNNRI